MKLLIILMLSSAVFADDSHLKLNTKHTYLPPEDSYHRNVDQYHYTLSKPRAIHETERVYVPHTNLNTHVADLPLRQRKLFKPAGEDSAALAQGSDHVVYATAPNSVFHTQINVQSQGNEFNAPKTHAIFEEDEKEGRLRSSDRTARGRSYKNEEKKHTSRIYHDDPHKHENTRPHENSYSMEHTRTDYPTKRPNYQGLNLINGEISAETAALLPGSSGHLHGNTQGINILNGNIRNKLEQSPQFGYNPQYDARTSYHQEHHDSKFASKKYGNHKEYDYHKPSEDDSRERVINHRTHDEHHCQHGDNNVSQYNDDNKNFKNEYVHGRQYHAHDKMHKNEYDHQNRQYNHNDKTHKNQHDHQRSLERQHHTSELHEKTQYHHSVGQNNHHQPQSKVTTMQAHVPAAAVRNQNHEEVYDPSASTLEVIYKPGDEINFAETKLIDYHDNKRLLDSYTYVREKPQQQQRRQSSEHGETDLRADGYHYGKPSVSFDF